MQALRTIGQNLWLDNLTRKILFGIAGITSNPAIFDKAIGSTDAYDSEIREKSASGKSVEELFFEMALEDLRRAAMLFNPTFLATNGVDGWVSIELSPLLASDTAGSIVAANRIHAQAATENLLVKIPGTPAGLEAIE